MYQADANKVIEILSQKIAQLQIENAILIAKLEQLEKEKTTKE